MTNLTELADRVEALEEPDRAVDYDIAHFVTGAHMTTGKAPNYTALFDAAMTLVTDRRGITLDIGPKITEVTIQYRIGDKPMLAEAKAATPALALCAAALRARGA